MRAADRTTILVIDDDVEMTEVLEEYLEPEGFTIEACPDGDSGLRFCAANAVLIAAIVIGYGISNPDQLPFTWPRVGRGAIISAGRVGAETYERGGQRELAKYLKVLAQDTGLEGSLFDSSRRDLGGAMPGLQIPPELWSRPPGPLAAAHAGTAGGGPDSLRRVRLL